MSRVKILVFLAALPCCCPALHSQQADLVLLHGTVLTVDAHDSVAQALAVRDSRIVVVGTDAQVMRLVGPATKVIDLRGLTATPGMIDTHSHYAEAGAEDLFHLKLESVTSIAEIVAAVQKRVAAAKPGDWIVGRGWDAGKLVEHRDPVAADLDGVSPRNPVLLINASGHYATLNTAALRLAGIDDATRNPANGSIERDSAGHVTGLVKEGALAPVRALVPAFTTEQIEQGILKEVDDLHRVGVTAFKDTATAAQWDALHRLNEQGKLDERVCMLWRAGFTVASGEQTLANLQRASPTPREYQHGRLAACGAKIFMDGTVMGRTAWSYDPWFTNGQVDAANTGYPALDPMVYRQMVRIFHGAGITVGTHAIGDRAIDWVMDTYAEVEQEKPMPGLRHSIIHANLPSAHAVTVMASLEKKYDAGYPEVQPVFLWWLGTSMAPSFGPERAVRAIPLKTFLDHGVRWSAGTDYGVAPMAPQYGLWASVERESLGGKHLFGLAQAVDVHTALRSYTSWAAPELFLEKEIGTLEAGKRADIAVWDRNPYTMPSPDLKDLRCVMTLMDGKVVYSR